LGGNAAGKAMPQLSLGSIGNSIAGIVGGSVGGGALMAIVGAIKNAVSKK